MKIIISLIILISSLFAESKLKFENKIIEEIAIQDSRRSFINFKVLCINGYQFLYTLDGKGDGSTTQMFYSPKTTNPNNSAKPSTPLKCNGYEETRD